MKKLLSIVLVFFCYVNNYSQEIQVINEIFEPNEVCKKSYRIRIINRERRVNRITVIIEGSRDNIEPIYKRVFNDREYVKILPDGGKVYETTIISNEYGFNHHFVEVKGIERKALKKRTKWQRNLKHLRCNLDNFKQYVLEPRGETLQEAINNQCSNASPISRIVNLLLPVELEEEKVYNIGFVGFNSSYWNIKKVRDINQNGNYADGRPVLTGPFPITCNDGGGETDTSNYDYQLLESNVFVYSNCISCPSQLDLLNPRFFGGTFPKNKHVMTTEGNTIQTQFTIKNVGSTSSEPTKVNFYLSDNYNSIFGIKANEKTISLPSLSPGEEFSVSPVFRASDFGRQLGNYYLVIDIVPGTNDSNRENNFVNIPVEVKSITGRNLIKPTLKSLFQKPYTINVYSFDGLLRSSHFVKNKEEEVAIVKGLPKGLFIIRNDRNKNIYKIRN